MNVDREMGGNGRIRDRRDGVCTVRERERGREGQTDRQTERERDRQTDRPVTTLIRTTQTGRQQIASPKLVCGKCRGSQS